MKILLNSLKSLLGASFWIILMLSFSDLHMTLNMLLSALLHEAGHVLALLLINKDFSFPRAVSSGFRIKTKSHLSYKEEIFVCAAGPLANIIVSLFLFCCNTEFAVINLATAVSNLLPLPECDGYKILYDLFSLLFDFEKSAAIMQRVSLVFLAVSVFLSLFLILKLNGGYWIFCIFFILLVRRILFFKKPTKSEDKREFESF